MHVSGQHAWWGGETRGGADTRGGGPTCIGGGPGCADGAMELGAGRAASPYVSVGCGHAMGGVRVQGKWVGGGGPSERRAAA